MPSSVTIHLVPEDLQAIDPTASGARTMSMSASMLLVSALGAVIGGGLATLFATGLTEGWSAAWPVGGLIGALVGAWAWSRKLESVGPAASTPREPMTIVLNDQGLTLTHQDFSSTYAWRAIAQVQKLSEHLLITTRWTAHFVIPARDFATRAEFDAYVADALRLFNASHGASHVQT